MRQEPIFTLLGIAELQIVDIAFPGENILKKESARMYTQRVGNSTQIREGQITFPTLYVPNIGSMQLCPLRQILLRIFLRFPQISNILTYRLQHSHGDIMLLRRETTFYAIVGSCTTISTNARRAVCSIEKSVQTIINKHELCYAITHY